MGSAIGGDRKFRKNSSPQLRILVEGCMGNAHRATRTKVLKKVPHYHIRTDFYGTFESRGADFC